MAEHSGAAEPQGENQNLYPATLSGHPLVGYVSGAMHSPASCGP